MQTGMHIGTIVDKQSLEPLTASIMQIIEARADQETIRSALDVLKHHGEVKNVSITGCHIQGDTTHEHFGPVDPDYSETEEGAE